MSKPQPPEDEAADALVALDIQLHELITGETVVHTHWAAHRDVRNDLAWEASEYETWDSDWDRKGTGKFYRPVVVDRSVKAQDRIWPPLPSFFIAWYKTQKRKRRMTRTATVVAIPERAAHVDVLLAVLEQELGGALADKAPDVMIWFAPRTAQWHVEIKLPGEDGIAAHADGVFRLHEALATALIALLTRARPRTGKKKKKGGP